MYLYTQRQITLSVNRFQSIGIAILLVSLMLPGPNIASAFMPTIRAGAIVASLGTDTVITHATDQIRLFIPNAVFVSVSTVDQLRAAANSGLGEIIYVGHGLPEGLEVGSTLVGWQDVQTIVKNSPSQVFLFAACYSLLAQVAGKVVFGSKGLVDVDEAAMWVTSLYYSLENQASKIPAIFAYFFQILVQKIVNPAGQLLAFLGGAKGQVCCCCCPIPMSQPMVAAQSVSPDCGGGGGGGVPPNSCWTIGTLTNNYCLALIQNIWHVHYNTLTTNTVFYTHPDVYVNYKIGYDDQFTVAGNNLVASHLAKDDLSNLGLGITVSTVLSGAVLGAIIGTTILPVLGTAVGALIGAIVGLLGYILQSQIIDRYVRDETQAGWMWLQNWYNDWTGSGSDIKLGGIGWFHFGVSLGIPFAYPLWYGGQDLGISGW